MEIACIEGSKKLSIISRAHSFATMSLPSSGKEVKSWLKVVGTFSGYDGYCIVLWKILQWICSKLTHFIHIASIATHHHTHTHKEIDTSAIQNSTFRHRWRSYRCRQRCRAASQLCSLLLHICYVAWYVLSVYLFMCCAHWTKLTYVGPGQYRDGWPSSGGYTISVCNKPTRSTQPCIPPGSLNRVPAFAGVRAWMSPLPGGR